MRILDLVAGCSRRLVKERACHPLGTKECFHIKNKTHTQTYDKKGWTDKSLQYLSREI